MQAMHIEALLKSKKKTKKQSPLPESHRATRGKILNTPWYLKKKNQFQELCVLC